MNRDILTYMAFDNDYQESKIVLFGAPFDGTVSFRPGTRFASAAMRQDSYGLETYSPYLDMDMEDHGLFDSGDLDLPFGNKVRVLDMIEAHTSQILADGKIPMMIGGEHLVTLGAFRAVQKKYEDVVILHFDAHADLRADYMDEPLSHATVIRRCHDIVGDGRIWQFGIRSGTKEEFTFAKDHTVMERYEVASAPAIATSLGKTPVYVTIDLDVLDPSIFPGTGTPEPGGVTFKQLMEAIHGLKGLNIVGADIVELSPQYDQSGVSTAAACKVWRELTLACLWGE